MAWSFIILRCLRQLLGGKSDTLNCASLPSRIEDCDCMASSSSVEGKEKHTKLNHNKKCSSVLVRFFFISTLGTFDMHHRWDGWFWRFFVFFPFPSHSGLWFGLTRSSVTSFSTCSTRNLVYFLPFCSLSLSLSLSIFLCYLRFICTMHYALCPLLPLSCCNVIILANQAGLV